MKIENEASHSRKPRADGLASRHAILDAACKLATTHGLKVSRLENWPSTSA